jgi:hypothetical protein
VRADNLALPPQHRIHVWLGEPEIDWSKVKAQADFLPVLALRDQHAADVIGGEILGHHKKALVIYGTFHFYRNSLKHLSLKQLVERDYPNSFFVVTPYIGFNEKSCSTEFERSAPGWPKPALLTPVRGTSLEGKLRRSGCTVMPAGSNTFSPTMTHDEIARAKASMEDESSGVAGDALLFLGPAAVLSQSPMVPDIYMDADYRLEISRRVQLMLDQPLSDSTADDNHVARPNIRP